METYRRSNMHLAYSLSSFLPVVSINCSELVVAVPMRNSSQLHCRQLQPEPGSKHELVLVVEGVHLGVRWGLLGAPCSISRCMDPAVACTGSYVPGCFM
jgi:hypothetical protein